MCIKKEEKVNPITLYMIIGLYEKIMCKIIKKIAVLVMTAVMCVSSTEVVNAANASVYINKGGGYEVHSISTTNAKPKSKKVNTPGIKKQPILLVAL